MCEYYVGVLAAIIRYQSWRCDLTISNKMVMTEPLNVIGL